MATRVVPASKILVCDICLKEQPEREATQPFGEFTSKSSVTLATTRMNCEIPMRFDTCNACHESVARYVASLLAVARGNDELFQIHAVNQNCAGEIQEDESRPGTL